MFTPYVMMVWIQFLIPLGYINHALSELITIVVKFKYFRKKMIVGIFSAIRNGLLLAAMCYCLMIYNNYSNISKLLCIIFLVLIFLIFFKVIIVTKNKIVVLRLVWFFEKNSIAIAEIKMVKFIKVHGVNFITTELHIIDKRNTVATTIALNWFGFEYKMLRKMTESGIETNDKGD